MKNKIQSRIKQFIVKVYTIKYYLTKNLFSKKINYSIFILTSFIGWQNVTYSERMACRKIMISLIRSIRRNSGENALKVFQSFYNSFEEELLEIFMTAFRDEVAREEDLLLKSIYPPGWEPE